MIAAATVLLALLVAVGAVVATSRTPQPARAAPASPVAPSGRATTARPGTATPPSPSSATSTAPQPGLVVGLGDSVTSGAACHCTPFVQTYAAALAKRVDSPVRAVNLGHGGDTTVELLALLKGNAAARQDLAQASVVLVTIGANDLVPLIARWTAGGCNDACVQPAVATMGNGLAAALHEIRSQAPRARLLVTDYWNVFEDGDVADAKRGPGFATWSDEVTGSANVTICAKAAAVGATCVDLYEPFEGEDGTRNPSALLADDGDHPNAAGHALIAATLLHATP
jgi:lysophospholipase L1-like esterase